VPFGRSSPARGLARSGRAPCRSAALSADQFAKLSSADLLSNIQTHNSGLLRFIFTPEPANFVHLGLRSGVNLHLDGPGRGGQIKRDAAGTLFPETLRRSPRGGGVQREQGAPPQFRLRSTTGYDLGSLREPCCSSSRLCRAFQSDPGSAVHPALANGHAPRGCCTPGIPRRWRWANSRAFRSSTMMRSPFS
jgi:hypothetical protein